MPYRPIKGRPTPAQMREAANWLKKNDVRDEAGEACSVTAAMLRHMATRDEDHMEIHRIAKDDPKLRSILADLDAAGLISPKEI